MTEIDKKIAILETEIQRQNRSLSKIIIAVFLLSIINLQLVLYVNRIIHIIDRLISLI